ncbi:hypothetical protein MBLNU13_g02880t1 [Cladosporium sp. NU13]
MLTLRLIATGLTVAGASKIKKRQQPDSNQDPFEDICQPKNSTGFPDFNAPCNSWSRTQKLCVYGEQVRTSVDGPDLYNYDMVDESMKQHSFGYQRDCICQSQQFDQMRGCMACNDALSGGSGAILAPSAIESFSSEYCAVSAIPTRGYIAAINSVLASAAEEIDYSTISLRSSQSVETKTDVSLYYTPAATGVSAWDVGLPTGASATFSSLHTSGGQIIPTAAARVADSETDIESSTDDAAQTSTPQNAPEGTKTVSEGRAVPTGNVGSRMIAGVMGAVAIAVAL